MKIWTCGNSPRSGSRNAWTRIKNVNGASRMSTFCNFFGAIQIISCRDWWSWTKPVYITMTRRQSNNQWSVGIAAYPAPSNFRVQKSPGKVLASIIFGSRQHPPHWLSSKGPNCQHRVLLISAGATEEHFEGKTPREVYQGGLVLAWKCSCSSGTCNPEETSLPGLPISWSPTLFSGCGPVRLSPFLWTEKQLEDRYLSSDAEVISAAETWLDRHFEFFFEWLAKVRATG